MSDGTHIEWTDATWNPVTGCTKVSPGCAHCYIDRTPAFRIHGRKFVKGKTDIRFHSNRLTEPLTWRRQRYVFVNSLSDLFHEDIGDLFIARCYAVMVAAYWHRFQVLTKRPVRRRELLVSAEFRELVANEAARHINGLRGTDPATGMTRSLTASMNLAHWFEDHARNIWEGVTAENQRFADQRIPQLLATPAAVRFVSYEPALGPLDFTAIDKTDPTDPGFSALTCTEDDEGTLGNATLDWVIVGGESGPGARPFDLQWARSAVAQCQADGVAVFVKQLGSNPEGLPPLRHHRKGDHAWRAIETWPEDLRVREWPV